MLCEICMIRKSSDFLDSEEIMELTGIKTRRKIRVCRKCKYVWTKEDIEAVLKKGEEV